MTPCAQYPPLPESDKTLMVPKPTDVQEVPTTLRGTRLVNDLSGTSTTHTHVFVDPDQFQAAVRGGDNTYTLLDRGVFRAELASIKIGQSTLQRGRETLPRLASSSMTSKRVG